MGRLRRLLLRLAVAAAGKSSEAGIKGESEFEFDGYLRLSLFLTWYLQPI